MKPKLLFYSDCYIFGGSENVIVHLTGSAAVRERFDVELAYARNRDYARGAERELPPDVPKRPVAILSNDNLFYRFEARGWSRLRTLLAKLPFAVLRRTGLYALHNFVRLTRLLREVRPDILHINNGGYPGAASCLTAVFSARAAGVRRIVFTVNNIAREPKGIFAAAIDRFVGRQVDLFITASRFAAGELIRKRGFPATKVRAIANAERPRPVTRDRAGVLAELGIASDRFVIVTVAYLTERKGHLPLLDALAKVRRDLPDVALVLVGDGEMRPRIERFIREHDLGGTVFLTGFRQDDRDFIAAADLFVLPSLRDEDMPYVILAAMALGKPIVSTRVAGISEQIRDGMDGVLLDPKALGELPRIIRELHARPDLRETYGRNAAARYREHFTVDRGVAEYTRVYEALC